MGMECRAPPIEGVGGIGFATDNSSECLDNSRHGYWGVRPSIQTSEDWGVNGGKWSWFLFANCNMRYQAMACYSSAGCELIK